MCIDHHVSNTGFTDLSKIEPQASSACEVLYGTMDADKITSIKPLKNKTFLPIKSPILPETGCAIALAR